MSHIITIIVMFVWGSGIIDKEMVFSHIQFKIRSLAFYLKIIYLAKFHIRFIRSILFHYVINMGII